MCGLSKVGPFASSIPPVISILSEETRGDCKTKIWSTLTMRKLL